MIDQFLPSESFDKIGIILETIKKARENNHPESPKWKGYVKQFFQAFGFSTQEKYPRLTTLSLVDGDQSPKAVTAFLQPGESFDELVPGLSWETVMAFAANFYHVDWGVLTNGLQLMVIQYQGEKIKQRSYWQDLDQVICEQSLVEFFPILMAFNIIKKAKTQVNNQDGNPIVDPEGSNSLARASKSVTVRDFLKQLLERAKTRTPLHAKVSLGFHNSVSVNAGKRGLSFGYIVVMDRGIVNLYIDNGDAEWNKSEYIRLFEHKTEIEESFGEALEWYLMPEQKSSYIRFTVSGYNLRDRESWIESQDKLIDAMIRLERAFRPHIKD